MYHHAQPIPFLMLSVLFFFASRDPVRNVAIVNGLIVGLCILAITPLLSLYEFLLSAE